MIRFLTIARVLYDKGFQELTQCAEFIKQNNSSVIFQWLGEIDKEYSNYVTAEQIKSFHDKNIIQYLGFQNDVRTFIRDADCIILPSYHEGMSRVLMESLAMSKPIITTNIPGCKETVIDEINGFLCEPKNSQSLIDAVSRFINLSPMQRNTMGIESRKYAEQRFDIQNVIKVYDDIIDNIMP